MTQFNHTFITCRLTQDELTDFDDNFISETSDLGRAIDSLLGYNVKVSFTYITDKSATICTVTGTKDNKRNKNKSISSWSDEPLEAAMMCLYKIHVIYADGTWENRESSSVRG